ncbi:WD40-repeat-containing domain protein [Flagelloscypha sp. PMI_526]|nr:WD40-repeat-containing domain protein [Flagelloscypha sp. PMI_526]
MIQTGVIETAHADLITDAAYDYYGLKLATCSLDQRIKIWSLDEENNTWNVEDDWRAHDAAVSKVSWAHPSFGPIIASSSFDRTVKIWEQGSALDSQKQQLSTATTSASSTPPQSRWIERAVLHDTRGTVRSVEFGPHHFGLKLATISSDNILRVYECLEQPSLATWHLTEEDTRNVATPMPGQGQGSTLDGPASASLVAQALQAHMPPTAGGGRPGLGNREADGGWCLSWCKDRYWGEVIAAGCGVTGVIQIIQLGPSHRPSSVLTLNPNPYPSSSSAEPTPASSDTVEAAPPTPYAITTVSWAPSCGRSYHLIATGGRDGHVRIWRVQPSHDGFEDEPLPPGPSSEWKSTIVGDFDSHKSTVGRVEWNVTGTILSSSGNDGRVRLWKASVGGSVWRGVGTLDVEQVEEGGGKEGDAEMEE